MYKLSRLLLFFAGLAAIYSVAILSVIGWPASGWFVLVAGLTALTRRGVKHLTTLGSARWATVREMGKAGMLDAPSGLILGRVKTKWSREKLIRLRNAVHTAVFAPTGAGKGVSCIVPFLLTSPESCVVLDYKGENAKLTAEHRRKRFGHRVVLLDPYRKVTDKPDTFNPLDFIDKDSPLALDDCNDLANALVVRKETENEPHWNDSAEAYLSAVIATVVGFGERNAATRSAQTVREIISNPDRLEMATKLMTESDIWGGLLAQMGGQLLHFKDKEKSSVLSSTLRHLRFLGTPAIAESTKASTFDPAELRKGKMTCFLIIPPDRMDACAGLLRMWISSLMRACVRGGLEQ